MACCRDIRPYRRFWFVALLFAWLLPQAVRAAAAPVYVVLWFDTEDYLLPASDDSALHIATFLTHEHIRGTFKVVGEKARTLERRGRTDVIEALKKHEIGYHSNFHSVEPTPALYLDVLGWDDGVAEFDRRERPGFDDVRRIFGMAPTCYGQPGSSWAPQTLGAMKQWGMKVYLDAGRHVGLDGKPFYYCGLLNIYQITDMPRTGLKAPGELAEAEGKFAAARKRLQSEGGGLISIIYHPCEFMHQQFWDGVNFRNGANPPRTNWKIPPQKTPEETRVAFDLWENYIRFMRHFDDVHFITASDAARLYADRANERSWTAAEVKTIAEAVGDEPGFQQRDGYALSAAEVMAILSRFVAERTAGHAENAIPYPGSPYGPSSAEVSLDAPLSIDADQFLRTTADLSDSIHVHGRIPPAVWLGSKAIPPEAFLRSLALVAKDMADGKSAPASIEIKPARLAAAKYVASDEPGLWKWVIFPPGFHAPHLMELARREAWTLKPAIRNDAATK
ncbi:MAG TPA: hypothetical protein VHX65_19295 [Pirellulales bacterium]|jgi:hypothetical protein|nr:hypothetical protein [Pirellulales bacterium]